MGNVGGEPTVNTVAVKQNSKRGRRHSWSKSEDQVLGTFVKSPRLGRARKAESNLDSWKDTKDNLIFLLRAVSIFLTTITSS